MTKPKKNINLPGHAFYRYDDAFKKKVLDDIAQGFISERKSALLYNIDRKSISDWRIAISRPVLTKLETPKVVKVRSESVSVSGVIALNKELKLVKQQLIHERLRSEALTTIIEIAELELNIPIQKKPSPQQSKK